MGSLSFLQQKTGIYPMTTSVLEQPLFQLRNIDSRDRQCPERVRRIGLSLGFFKKFTVHGTRALDVVESLPDDVSFVASYVERDDVLWVVLESSEFGPVQEGQEIPTIAVELRERER